MSIYAKYLVCYDVSSNSRRKKFSDALKDLGPAEVRALARKATELLDPKEDKCFWFPCRLEVKDIQKCIGYDDWSFAEVDGHGTI